MGPPVFWIQVGRCLEDLCIHHTAHHPQKPYRGNRKAAPLEAGWHCHVQGTRFRSNVLIWQQVQPVSRRSITPMPPHSRETTLQWGLLLEGIFAVASPGVWFQAVGTFLSQCCTQAAALFTSFPPVSLSFVYTHLSLDPTERGKAVCMSRLKSKPDCIVHNEKT